MEKGACTQTLLLATVAASPRSQDQNWATWQLAPWFGILPGSPFGTFPQWLPTSEVNGGKPDLLSGRMVCLTTAGISLNDQHGERGPNVGHAFTSGLGCRTLRIIHKREVELAIHDIFQLFKDTACMGSSGVHKE